MNYAETRPLEVIYHPTAPFFADEHTRQYQGCPTIAVTKKGRIWVAWHAGGVREPHMDNYGICCYSDDKLKTKLEPYFVIPSSKEFLTHSVDPELWTAPDGRLFYYWTQNEVVPRTEENLKRNDFPCIENFEGFPRIDGYMFIDYSHNLWCMVCDDPDAEKPVFSAPRRVDRGFLRNKTCVLDDGRWINFNYDQKSWNYGMSTSFDKGETWIHHYGSRKVKTPFDESMAYQMKDGRVRMMARTSAGCIAECYSSDRGETWTDGAETDIVAPNTRFFVSRTPTGRILLVCSDHPKDRTNLTVKLSDDDGKTWKWQKLVDARRDISYPDCDFDGENIYLIYDRERIGAREILCTHFTENDIMKDEFSFDIQILSKA